ncbi:MAG: MFS transporter [Anaerolineales bacterium]|nr:MFS transporter [Anaerolineales bacterium]
MLARLSKSFSILTPTLRWFLLGMVLANIAGAMLYSYLALYLQSLGASIGQVGLVFSLASIVPLVLQVFGGWLSDTIGRLRAIAIGSAIASFGYLLFVIAPSWQWALAALALEYISGTTVGPSYSAFIADQSEERVRGQIFGLSNGIFLVIGVIGPPLAGLLIDWRDYRFMLAVTGVIYWAATVLRIWMARAERFNAYRPVEVQPVRLQNFGRQLRVILGLMFAGGILTWILILDGVSDVSARLSEELQPLFLSEVGSLGVVQIGLLRSILFFTMMVATPPAGWLSDRIGEHRTIALGFLVGAVGLSAFILARDLPSFALAGILSGLGSGLVNPAYSALASKAVPPENRGLAFGFFHSSISLLSLPAPWLGARLWENYSPRLPFGITTVAMAVSAFLAYLKLRIWREEDQQRPAA